MSDLNKLIIIARELRAYGQGFRTAEFLDGRSVRYELELFAGWVESEDAEEDFTDGTELEKANKDNC